jgi:ATP-dependent Clp endopeptidase proteolytic subunit ClpP
MTHLPSSAPKYRFRGSVEPKAGIRASVLEPATEGVVSTLRLYDPIDSYGGDWGVSAKEFSDALAKLPADTEEIRLHINSPGGEVFEAVTILNLLRQHKAKVVAYVDGLAASAASFLAAGADETIMGQNATQMVHDAWGFAVGNAGDMHSAAEMLDKLSNNIASVYAEKAGGSTEDWRTIMRAETWLTAEEAVTAGLADRIDKPAATTSGTKNSFDLTVFAHEGRENAPDPTTILPRRPPTASALDSPTTGKPTMAARIKPPAEPAETNPQPKGADTMSAEVIKGLRERLGIPAEATLDDAGILAAVDEALAEQSDNTPVAAAGTVVLDEAQYTELKASAAEGREARQQQLAAARAALVDGAVADGRITPARREHWINTLEADPGMEPALAGLAKGLVPLQTVGYTGGIEESSDEDRTYNKIFTKES